jgi:UDP-glucose 4,6-dehydratase
MQWRHPKRLLMSSAAGGRRQPASRHQSCNSYITHASSDPDLIHTVPTVLVLCAPTMSEVAYKPRSILVTGGCGFIGSNFVRFVTSKHESVSVVNIDRMTYCSREPDIASPLYKLYKTNITDANTVLHILHRHNIDAVVHFAAQTHVDRSFGNSMIFTDDNVRGTHTLLECMRAYGNVKRFIHISTDEVYGEVGDDHVGCEEQSLLNPTNPYAATKASAEFLVRSYGHSFNLPFIITRGNNVYGEYQFPDKIIPKFVNHLLNGQKLPVHGNGNSRRNFIHAEDVCSAVWKTLELGKVGDIYNIGSDDEFSVLGIADEILRIMRPGESTAEHLEYVKDRDFNDYRYCINTVKLRALGWKPEVEFKSGLQRVIAWYSSHQSYWEHARKWLVYGANGWIGAKVVKMIEERGDVAIKAESRADDAQAVSREVGKCQPDQILSVLGRTHGPGYGTIDYLEQKGKTYINVRDNLFAPFVLARIAEQRNIHFCYLGTGCIFTYEDGDQSFDEECVPNFFGSEYSIVKGFTDQMTRLLPGMLNCRIRMPISSDDSPRNFIQKLITYENIHSVPNSMTVLEELLPIMLEFAANRETGTVNLTNPGVIAHNEILELYKEHVDADFTWKNFSGAELLGVIAAARSNNKLSTGRLERLFPAVRNIHDAVEHTIRAMKEHADEEYTGSTNGM